MQCRSRWTMRMPPMMASRRGFWQALVQVERVLTAFRARFLGKVAPSISSGAA